MLGGIYQDLSLGQPVKRRQTLRAVTCKRAFENAQPPQTRAGGLMGKGGTIRLLEAPSRVPRQWDPSHINHILNVIFSACPCAFVWCVRELPGWRNPLGPATRFTSTQTRVW